MTQTGKYIVGRLEDSSIPVAILFEHSVAHNVIGTLLFKDRSNILGAGFFTVLHSATSMKVRVNVYGKSVGLNVESNKETDLQPVMRALGILERYIA